jgi:hypothetical protein
MQRAAEQAGWVVTQMTPQKAEDLFGRVGNMDPSKSNLDRLPKALGERREAERPRARSTSKCCVRRSSCPTRRIRSPCRSTASWHRSMAARVRRLCVPGPPRRSRTDCLALDLDRSAVANRVAEEDAEATSGSGVGGASGVAYAWGEASSGSERCVAFVRQPSVQGDDVLCASAAGQLRGLIAACRPKQPRAEGQGDTNEVHGAAWAQDRCQPCSIVLAPDDRIGA